MFLYLILKAMKTTPTLLSCFGLRKWRALAGGREIKINACVKNLHANDD